MKRPLIFLLCLIVLLTAGCSTAGQSGQGDRTIKIAVMDTEPVFNSDASYLNGIDLAIEDLNTLYAEQGYSISWQFYDDDSNFQQGMTAINEIVSDSEVTAVVGTSSLNILDVAADVLDAAGKLLITYYSSSDTLFDNGYTHVFRNCFGEDALGSGIADYAAGRSDIRRVAVYHSDTDFERRLVRSFIRCASANGLEIVDVATTTPLEAELETMLTRWEALDVDTVFVSQYDSDDAFDILRRVRALDPDINVLGDFAFDYTDDLLDNGDISDDIYIATPIPLEPGPEVESFYRKYREKFGVEPTQWAVQLYDSVRMVVDTAVRIENTDPTAIAQALREPEGYTGVGGTLTFDEDGRLTQRQPQIMVSQDGLFRFLEG